MGCWRLGTLNSHYCYLYYFRNKPIKLRHINLQSWIKNNLIFWHTEVACFSDNTQLYTETQKRRRRKNAPLSPNNTAAVSTYEYIPKMHDPLNCAFRFPKGIFKVGSCKRWNLKFPCDENESYQRFSYCTQPGLGQITALHAFPVARNYIFHCSGSFSSILYSSPNIKWNCVTWTKIRLLLVIWWTLFCPAIPFMVDWIINIKNQPTHRANSQNMLPHSNCKHTQKSNQTN